MRFPVEVGIPGIWDTSVLVISGTRGANETRQLASYLNSTRSKLDQNSTRARARLELLTSRVEQLVTRLKKLARNSKIFCI